MSKIIRTGGAALALALALTALSSSTAAAQSQQGQFRIGADITIFDGIWFPDFDTAAVSFGVLGSPVTGLSTTTGAFLSPGGLGPSLAYCITEAIVIGGRLELGGTWVDAGGVDVFVGHLGILPFFEYNFVGDATIQPFVGAELGYDYFFGDFAGDDGRFRAGGIGGLHIFATPDFSITPTGHLGFAYAFGADSGALAWGISVQFLGWLGGSGASVTVR